MKSLSKFLFILTILTAACSPKSTPARISTDELKIMSYNVHHCNPPSKPGFIDVDAIVAVLKKQQPDLVALQEIDINTKRSGNIDEATQIAHKAGYANYYFAKAIDYDGGGYGVAMLSKFPLSQQVTYKLPTDIATGGEPRVLALATITLPGGKTIRFGCTHLDAQKNDKNRLLQIEEINRITIMEKQPIILAGDFNAVENSDVIRILDQHFQRTCTACAFTIPQIQPNKAIDFIAYKTPKQFSVISHNVIQEAYASDHLPVIAVLNLH